MHQVVFAPTKGGVHTIQVRLSGVPAGIYFSLVDATNLYFAMRKTIGSRDEELAAVGIWTSVYH